MLSQFRSSLDTAKKQRLYSELGIGVLGPMAGGRETQVSIHKWLNNIEPLGWQFQLSNHLAMNYRVKYEKGLAEKKLIDIIAYGEANAGTLYDNIALGLQLRTGKREGYFASPPSGKLQLYGYMRGKVMAVGYNATLQGGMFGSDLYTLSRKELNTIVAGAYPGIVFSYRKLSLEYGKAYITHEIKKGKDHGWGHVNITVRF